MTATPNDLGASAAIADAVGSTAGTTRTTSLEVGGNEITITVTAADGQTLWTEDYAGGVEGQPEGDQGATMAFLLRSPVAQIGAGPSVIVRVGEVVEGDGAGESEGGALAPEEGDFEGLAVAPEQIADAGVAGGGAEDLEGVGELEGLEGVEGDPLGPDGADEAEGGIGPGVHAVDEHGATSMRQAEANTPCTTDKH